MKLLSFPLFPTLPKNKRETGTNSPFPPLLKRGKGKAKKGIQKGDFNHVFPQ